MSMAQESIIIKENNHLNNDNKILPIISRPQFLKCFENSKLVSLEIKQLNKQKTLMGDKKNSIEELKNELELKGDTLDFHSSDSVLAYNQLSKKLHQLSQDYNTNAKLYNDAVKKNHDEIMILKNQCNNKRLVSK
jgi:hypothetical protein